MYIVWFLYLEEQRDTVFYPQRFSHEQTNLNCFQGARRYLVLVDCLVDNGDNELF